MPLGLNLIDVAELVRVKFVLMGVIIWLGIYPAPVLRRMEPSAHKFVTSVQQGAQAASTVTSPIVAAAGAQR